MRSTKRRKTISARMKGEVLELRLPAWMGEADEAKWVEKMSQKFEARRSTDAIDLTARAAELATRYDLPVPTTIRWVDNQTTRWGSCTPADGTIRISSTLAGWPRWVLDFVVVHELAHLLEPSHGPAFRALVARYPKAERATGFLIAKGILDE